MDDRWTYSRTMAVHSGELAPSARALAKALTTYKKDHFSPLATPSLQAKPFKKSSQMEQKAVNENDAQKGENPASNAF